MPDRDRSQRLSRAVTALLTLTRQGLGRLSGREGFIALAILLPCMGAAAGAMADPNHTLRYGAEAAIAVKPGPDAVRMEQYARAATLPRVVSGARAAAAASLSASDLADTAVVEVDRTLRLVFVRVQERSQARAVRLANGLAERALLLVEESVRAVPDGIRRLGDFESGGLERWGLVRSAFNNPPLDLYARRGWARFGSGMLRVRCAGPACGTGVRVYGSFHAGATYLVEGWLRSTAARSHVTLLVGASGRDLAVSSRHRLSPRWRRLHAAWTPEADAGWAEVAFQTTSAEPVTFDIDAVRLLDPLPAAGATAARRWPTAERRSERNPGAPSAALVPAVPMDLSPESRTAAVLLGAGAGFMVALGAAALALLATRRRDIRGAAALGREEHAVNGTD